LLLFKRERRRGASPLPVGSGVDLWQTRSSATCGCSPIPRSRGGKTPFDGAGFIFGASMMAEPIDLVDSHRQGPANGAPAARGEQQCGRGANQGTQEKLARVRCAVRHGASSARAGSSHSRSGTGREQAQLPRGKTPKGREATIKPLPFDSDPPRAHGPGSGGSPRPRTASKPPPERRCPPLALRPAPRPNP
jgi:hypothetical protein